MSVARHHSDWLELVPHSGPFLSLSELLRVFPQGLDKREPEAVKKLFRAYEEWRFDIGGPGNQRRWILHVFQEFLGWPPELLVEGQQIPPGLEAKILEHGETLRPDLVLIGPSGTPSAGKPQLLIQLLAPNQEANRILADKNWKASPETRMAELLRATNVPLGLLSNGEEWTLVFAQRGETSGFGHWHSTLWIEEQVTLRAFQSLLDLRRFFSVAEKDTTLGMLRASLDDQAELTTSLGNQVRDAVEVLIRAFDKIDQDSKGALLTGVSEKVLYDASLTLMMRLVFLFSAEERGLLDLGKPLYDRNYAVSTLIEHLQEVADQFGEEVLERRFDGWARLLAVFRAVHAGVKHQDLPIPEYQGSLFDPDRFPFLEGRASNTKWENTTASPLPINNRVVLHLLTSLQMLKMKLPGGGPATLRRVSFRGLDIEQIGHVYEGLLDYTAARAAEPVLGLVGSKNIPLPFASLSDLESWRSQGDEVLIEKLSEITKRTPATLKRAIEQAETVNGPKLLIACHQNQALFERAVPFASLIRNDSFEQPVVVLPQGIHIAKGSDRRSTGTHYTPRTLTEPIVQHTLEPLVYAGPAEGLPKEEWQLRTPKEILGLKVCDMAMGSGAFLVQTCRYLAERLVESWENAETARPGEVLVTPEGDFSKGSGLERLIPKEPEERVAIARRLVTDRCLYGVDVNPMAVEMAKLSLWLITVQRDRPFTFLDHALKCGDSLLGVTTIDQIANFSLRPGNWPMTFAMAELIGAVQFASVKRSELELLSSDDNSQLESKFRLHSEVEAATEKVKLLADCLVAFEMRNLEGDVYYDQRAKFAADVEAQKRSSPLDFQKYTRELLNGRQPFHWPLEFSEVFDHGGFDALIGNPPFLGGSGISGIWGVPYRNYLVTCLANGKKGNADIIAYFFLRAASLGRPESCMGLIATKTVAQGETREIGLEQMLESGLEIYRANSSQSWPGSAALAVAHLWMRLGKWTGTRILDGVVVRNITSFLADAQETTGSPHRLRANAGLSFTGTKIYGEGFLLTPQKAEDLIASDPSNKDILFPYLNGDDLNSDPSQRSSRWTINFGNRTLDEARRYKVCFEIVLSLVKPYRDTVKRDRTRENWWLFEHLRDELYANIGASSEVLVCSEVTKFLAFSYVPSGAIFAANLDVFPHASFDSFAVLQSSLHDAWARFYSAHLETRLKYSPGNAFETFPFPLRTTALSEIGQRYHKLRREIMNERQEGLTRVYNRFHNPQEVSKDIARLRAAHLEMDQAVIAAYAWNDLLLNHDFHETKQGVRYTISEADRRNILYRLLGLNLQRHQEEVRAGLHVKASKGKKLTKTGSKQQKVDRAKSSMTEVTVAQPDLFEAPEEKENDE